MQSRKKVLRLFRAFGLGASETTLYLDLLLKGKVNRNELFTLANLSGVDLESNLNRLTNLGLVIVEMGKPMKYKAIRPSVALKALMDKALWNREVTLEDSLKLDKSARYANVTEMKNAYLEIVSLLEPFYEKMIEPPIEDMWVLKTRDEVAVTLSDMITRAEREILASDAPPWAPLPLVWEALLDRLNAGIIYRRVVDFSTIIHFGLDIIQRHIDKLRIRLRIAQEIKEKYYIVDQKEVMTYREVTYELPQYIGVTIRNPTVALKCATDFEVLWRKAKSVRLFLRKARAEKDKMLANVKENLTDFELKVFSKIASFGIFNKKDHFSLYKSELEASLKKLELMGLIEKTTHTAIAGPDSLGYIIKLSDTLQKLLVGI